MPSVPGETCHGMCAQVSGEKEFFAKMVVDAVSKLDLATLDMSLLGVKKVQGGGLRDSFLVDGVAFKKTFSYAGFEMQPKAYTDPKVLLLNIELELKSEKENAEVSTSHMSGMYARFTS
jgi:T-complex protein 1 subunit eta